MLVRLVSSWYVPCTYLPPPRRNELLLKPQPAPPQKPAAPQRMKASKSGPPSATGFSTALQPVKQTDSVASLQQGAAPLPRGSRGKLGAGKLQTISEKKLGAVSSQATLSKKKHQPMSSQMVPVKRAGKVPHIYMHIPRPTIIALI